MCSRYETERSAVLPRFDIDEASEIARTAAWGEVRPTDPILLIAYGGEPVVRRWGLTADWATRPIVNARAEDVSKKKTFQPLLAGRCIIPATAYFEWRVEDGRKVKTRIGGGRLLAIAGFMNHASAVLATCAAAPSIAHVHDRMPAILPEDAIADWLDPEAQFAAVQHLLAPARRIFECTDAGPAKRAPPRQASLF